MTKRDATSVRQDETPTIENYKDIVSSVDKAIENKDTSVIEETEDKNHLKYMQKDVEVRLLRKGSTFSSLSLYIGNKGIGLCALAIGLSFSSINIPIDGLSETTYHAGGLFIMCLGIIIIFIIPRTKWFKNIDKDAEFMCDLILKIEEKLLK